MTKDELKIILDKHALWLADEKDGERADLRGADLSDAYLSGAYLSGADLSDADLRGAYLRGADLRDADLRGAYLRGADLSGADLSGAYLRDADLRGAYLRGAYLRGADLRDADLRGADLRGAKELPFIPLSCPDTGAFIGWKKAKLIDFETKKFVECIVKMEICADARRSSATTEKCRADMVEVLQFETLDGKVLPNESDVVSNFDNTFHYRVGEIITTSFDDNRWNECAPGIHFFINRQSAVNYLI